MHKKDLLQRTEYIDLLENIVEGKIRNHEGFSLAIDGRWGCGKTFIVEQLESKLKSHNYMVLHYNCWENDFYEEPLVAIIHTIIEAINQTKRANIPEPRQRDWKRNGKIAAKFLGKIAAMILKNKVGVDLGELKFDIDLEKLAFVSKEALESDRDESLSTNFDSLQPLKNALLQIRKVLLYLKLEFNGVIFIVDELDRCLPKYSIKVLERLHHICFNTNTDKNIFIQIVALNKDEMLGSIARTFGRNFYPQMKIDYIHSNFNTHAPSSATLKTENIHEKQNMFADYYFQKFFQMVIPVPLGKMLDKDLYILNGFEKEFSADGVVTKEYIAKFLSDVLNMIPIRIKKEYLDFVKTVHQITALNSKTPIEISLGVLGVELIDALFRIIFKISKPTLSIQNKEKHSYSYKFRKPFELEYTNNNQEIAKAFIEWGTSSFDYLSAFEAADAKEHYINNMQDSASYIKAFYTSNSDSINNKQAANPSDVSFIEEFRKNMDILAPSK